MEKGAACGPTVTLVCAGLLPAMRIKFTDQTCNAPFLFCVSTVYHNIVTNSAYTRNHHGLAVTTRLVCGQLG